MNCGFQNILDLARNAHFGWVCGDKRGSYSESLKTIHILKYCNVKDGLKIDARYLIKYLNLNN